MKPFALLILMAFTQGALCQTTAPTPDPLSMKLSDGVTVHFDSIQKRREYEASHPGTTPTPAAAASDLKTLSGHVYKNARVFRVEPDGITYMVTGGMPKIPFTDLPDSVKKQYGYDPAKAQTFAVADEQDQNRAYQSSQAQLAAEANKKQSMYEKAAQHATDDSFHDRNDAPLSNQPQAILDPDWKGGLKTLMKVSLNDVATSPFSLKDALIEMRGIDRAEKREVSAGVYEMTFWSDDAKCVSGTLPAKQAFMAERCKTLFVAVKKPNATPPEIYILGSGTTYQGLSTMPTVIWK